jgi:hypothetical protein
MIKQQSRDKAFMAMEETIEDFLNGKKITSLEQIIKNRFGVNVNFDINPFNLPAIAVPYTGTRAQQNINTNIKYLKDFIDSDGKPKKRIPKELKKGIEQVNSLREMFTKGVSLDKEEAYISGLDYTFKIYISREHFVKEEFTPAEALSIILHEVGHIFTLVENIGRKQLVDTPLSGAMDDLLNGDVDKAQKRIHKIVSKGSLEEDIVETVETLRKENNYSLKAQGMEASSDIFAARCGYGVALGKALNKLDLPNLSNTGNATVLIITQVTLVSLLTLIIGIVGITGMFGFVLLATINTFTALLAEFILGSLLISLIPDEHEPIKKRIQRLRKDAIRALRTKQYEGDAQFVLDTIKELEEVIEDAQADYSIITTLISTPFPQNVKQLNTIMRKVEDMTEHNGVVQTERLKQLMKLR